MKECQISVIIPVYNAEKHLAECLDSVLGQSLRELEILCIDDGSVDESLAILERYAEKDDRVRVFRQRNRYAGVARNRGLEHARGEYIAFLDADDVFLPGSLELLYHRAKKYKLDLIKAGFEYENVRSGKRWRTDYSRLSGMSWLQRRQVLRLACAPERLLNVPDVPWNGLYRRQFLEEWGIRFNSLRCVNDHSFFVWCLLKAERFMVSQRSMVRYRVEQGDSLVDKRANRFEDQISSAELVWDLCKEADRSLTRKIMGQELNGLFYWYQRVQTKAEDPRKLEKQVADFLKALDESCVGDAFLRGPYCGEYHRLRYDSPAPPRPNVFCRGVQCWKEHGTVYTVKKFLGKE